MVVGLCRRKEQRNGKEEVVKEEEEDDMRGRGRGRCIRTKSLCMLHENKYIYASRTVPDRSNNNTPSTSEVVWDSSHLITWVGVKRGNVG